MKIPGLRIEFCSEDRKEILERIDQCLVSGQLALGQNMSEFEADFSLPSGFKHAVATSSGGAALQIAMSCLGVKGHEVLVPTNTYAATAAAVMNAGGRVQLVDAAADTFGVSIETLERALTPDTSGVVLVHIGGIITPEIEAIGSWCTERGLWMFEDAAHAHGSTLNGLPPGKHGSGAAYSFFATKVVTCGEGGMLVTDDDSFAEKARSLRNYGKPAPWDVLHTRLGSNWRLSEISAAVGVVHLRRLDEFISRRHKVADRYTQRIREIPELIPVLPQGTCSWYKYIILLPEDVSRDAVRAGLKQKGVTLAGGVYEVPLHRQPVFLEEKRRFPIADRICSTHVCLPIFATMTESEVDFVVNSLGDVLDELRC